MEKPNWSLKYWVGRTTAAAAAAAKKKEWIIWFYVYGYACELYMHGPGCFLWPTPILLKRFLFLGFHVTKVGRGKVHLSTLPDQISDIAPAQIEDHAM